MLYGLVQWLLNEPELDSSIAELTAAIKWLKKPIEPMDPKLALEESYSLKVLKSSIIRKIMWEMEHEKRNGIYARLLSCPDLNRINHKKQWGRTTRPADEMNYWTIKSMLNAKIEI